ncbi:RCC1/BLIP-II [Periconia macrospinosa]|uniref:RCC1/BLIP-II n=1 Tax=Periconia macrospinosa TaxID=97972 RepID=A0A2V1EA36_9PLEO|nr:RCC1/BLIP-II [Periconia macrospinosa]
MPYKLFVFGSNGEGQLGVPKQDIIQKPVVASSWPCEHTIATVRSGDNHTLFLTSSGKIFGAGDNRKGQLGTLPNESPEQKRIERIVELYGSLHFCAATCESSAYITNISRFGSPQEGVLTTEGTSHWGELGIPSIASTAGCSREEFQQTLPNSVIDFAAGGWHYAAILSSGEVWGWGKSRLDQLGPALSSQQKVLKPTRIEENIPFKPIKVICGKEFTYLASTPENGEHYLLGRDKSGLRTSMPPHIKGWKTIGATWHAIFVLFEDGRVVAWGKDNLWKLIPDNLPSIEQMAVGSEHVLALTQEGKLISWGWGKHGNCGDLSTLTVEVKNDMVSGVWNNIEMPGKIAFIGAGFCTSYVLVETS